MLSEVALWTRPLSESEAIWYSRADGRYLDQPSALPSELVAYYTHSAGTMEDELGNYPSGKIFVSISRL